MEQYKEYEHIETSQKFVLLNCAMIVVDIIGIVIYCFLGDCSLRTIDKCIIGGLVSTFWSFLVSIGMAERYKIKSSGHKLFIWAWLFSFIISLVSIFMVSPRTDLLEYRGLAIVTNVSHSTKTISVYLKVIDNESSYREYDCKLPWSDRLKFKKHDTVLVTFSTDSLNNLHSYTSVSKISNNSFYRRYSRPVAIIDNKEIGNDTWNYFMLEPMITYDKFGCNLVYKASYCESYLKFIDIIGNQCSIKYTPGNNTSIPDTILVSRNINEAIDNRFIVCAPEVNTPENWAKISDYGYIFHYDVYSKEEIESQCPQIKNYVEKYKERMKEK